jgi:hypothetical protein
VKASAMAALLPALLLGWVDDAAASGDCAAVFSPVTAKRVFERVRTQTGADRCTVRDVRTDRSRMEIVLSQPDGGILPAVILEPSECAPTPDPASKTLAITVPPEVARACPDAVASLVAAVPALDLPTARVEATFSLRTAEVSWVLVGLALLGASTIALMGLRRGVGPDGSA